MSEARPRGGQQAEDFRIEHDSMGEVRVPAEAKWRAQTQRAVENFPITGSPISIYPDLIAALALVKQAAALTNHELGLLDKDQHFYFMEVNARIQVEHPITEMITGIDLIKEQIRIAAGLSLAFRQQDIKLTGHSFECRINAEDPEKFTPCPGLITRYRPPGGIGVRVDSVMESNSMVVPHYDSMIAKLITHGRDREESMARMRRQ